MWAASWQNQRNGMCAQRRHRSAWASAQSDQSLLCAFFIRTAKTLIRLGGCQGWSESSLGAHAILFVLSCGGSYAYYFQEQITVTNRSDTWINMLQMQKIINYQIAEATRETPVISCYNTDLDWKSSDLIYVSRLITKPTKWHMRPAKTQISLGIAQSDQSLHCALNG